MRLRLPMKFITKQRSECAKCGQPIVERKRKPCPKCGSLNRTVIRFVEDTIPIRDKV